MRKKFVFMISAFLGVAVFGQVPALAAGDSEVVGLRRLTEQEYRNSIADIFGKDIVVQGVFEPGKRMGGLIEPAPRFFPSRRWALTPTPRWPTASRSRSPARKTAPAGPVQAQIGQRSRTMPAPRQFFDHYGLMLFRRPLTAR